MANEETSIKLLEFLKRRGPINTFRLARVLNIDRYKLQDAIKELEEKGAVEFKFGLVRFLKLPAKEKKEAEKPAKIKKILLSPKKKTRHKAKQHRKKRSRSEVSRAQKGGFQDENKSLYGAKLFLKEDFLKLEANLHKKQNALQAIQEENEKLKEKLSLLKKSSRKRSKIKSKLKEKKEIAKGLKQRVKTFQQNIKSHKVIRKTSGRIKKIPASLKEKLKNKNLKQMIKIFRKDSKVHKGIQKTTKRIKKLPAGLKKTVQKIGHGLKRYKRPKRKC